MKFPDSGRGIATSHRAYRAHNTLFSQIEKKRAADLVLAAAVSHARMERRISDVRRRRAMT